jgi:hypothetical protein
MKPQRTKHPVVLAVTKAVGRGSVWQDQFLKSIRFRWIVISADEVHAVKQLTVPDDCVLTVSDRYATLSVPKYYFMEVVA